MATFETVIMTTARAARAVYPPWVNIELWGLGDGVTGSLVSETECYGNGTVQTGGSMPTIPAVQHPECDSLLSPYREICNFDFTVTGDLGFVDDAAAGQARNLEVVNFVTNVSNYAYNVSEDAIPFVVYNFTTPPQGFHYLSLMFWHLGHSDS